MSQHTLKLAVNINKTLVLFTFFMGFFHWPITGCHGPLGDN